MSIDPDEVLELFRRFLPRRAGPCELAFASGYATPVWRDEHGYLRVALLLASFDPPDADAPCEVREQEVGIGDDGAHAPGRWLAYVEGNLRALPAIVGQFGEAARFLMPHELFAYEALLADETLQSADEFAAALSDPARLTTMNEAAREAEWREQLEPLGLAEHAAEVRALARPSLRLHLERSECDEADEEDDADEADEDDETCLVGQTRLGGAPDLPPSLPWPEVDGTPLTFVAQFDLGELSRRGAASELPAHGLLSFFYEPCPPEEVRGHPVRVLHLTDIDALARRPVPAGVEPLMAYDIAVEEELQFPAIESHFFYESLSPAARVPVGRGDRGEGSREEVVPFEALAYFIAAANELGEPERPYHRLLGHPAAIQGDPYLDVEIDTRPQGWDGWVDGSPESLQIQRQALRWRLLLQIDAQEEDGLLLNQDGGFFYFWIPADALARHDWSQARGALQCH